MPTLKLTNLISYKAYWADIAARHKSIEDFKYGDKDVMRNDNLSDMAGQTFLWATPYDGTRYTDLRSDNIDKIKRAQIAVLTVPDSLKFTDEEAAFEFCESIIEDIITVLVIDKAGKLNTGTSEWEMISLDFSSMKTAPVESKIGSTNYIGCELSFDFIENTHFGYDATKWNS